MYEIRPEVSEKIVKHLLSTGFFPSVGKKPPSVHISDRRGIFFQTIAADFAVEGAAANIKAPGCLMFVPIRLLEYSGN